MPRAAATRRAKREALASPPPTSMLDVDGSGDGGEENFLSVPDGAGAMALDFSSPIAAAGGKGDAQQGCDDGLNMEVSPLRQHQQPKSAAKKKAADEVRKRERS